MMQFANLILHYPNTDVSFTARAYTPHPSLFFASGARSNFCRAAVTSGRLFLLPLRYSYQTERWRNQCK